MSESGEGISGVALSFGERLLVLLMASIIQGEQLISNYFTT